MNVVCEGRKPLAIHNSKCELVAMCARSSRGQCKLSLLVAGLFVFSFPNLSIAVRVILHLTGVI